MFKKLGKKRFIEPADSGSGCCNDGGVVCGVGYVDGDFERNTDVGETDRGYHC